MTLGKRVKPPLTQGIVVLVISMHFTNANFSQMFHSGNHLTHVCRVRESQVAVAQAVRQPFS